uniref:Uncharacterized protein n=1 Tax=Anguilla anguilla TaxID=7936 RepID=A0A0E9TNE9_ANGAN
MSLYYSVLGFT